jgi:hypothetical protein
MFLGLILVDIHANLLMEVHKSVEKWYGKNRSKLYNHFGNKKIRILDNQESKEKENILIS